MRHKFPSYISDYLSKALYGFGSEMATVLKSNIKNLPENMRKNRDKIADEIIDLRKRGAPSK